MLILPMLFEAFQPRSPHRAAPPRSFLEPRAKNLLASCDVWRIHLHFRLQWSKSFEQHG
jgi:hypothetical protein